MAFVLAFLFGIASSIGPCMATRVVMVSGMTQSTGRPARLVVGVFLAGLTAVYVAFAFTIRLVVLVQAYQSVLLVGAAAAFVVAAVLVFLAAYREDREHLHSCANGPQPHGLLGVLGVGALSALNFSPCCAPWLMMTLTYTTLQGHIWLGAAIMVPFALGHALPLFAYGELAQRLFTLFESGAARRAVPLANTSMLLFMAAFCAVQA